MTFQEIIQTLNTFWGKQGCLVGQPYGVEVGAGTGNPNTFFRVLGPEPFNVAYVEPSRRPTDGRYGQSPNRFQHYYQYQVILKPAPKFNQELFIESLIAIGLDPEKHDIRFVEDNWESTPLGAWGLGWEIWCDGMEVAQYTYFQQMAGIPLEVPALEITYGLERLAMYIQNVDHYKDLKWNETTTYADLFERHEYWQATHNFETSTPESLQTLFTTYEKEVQTQLERKNYWGAYDYLLKVSHAFNLLDARGMVSVSDRVAKFGMMGKYSKAVGQMYLEERESLGFPLKNRMSPINFQLPIVNSQLEKNDKYQKNVAIVELGFEEIPSEYLSEWSSIATHSWLKQQLKANGITYRKAYIYFTPRRIVIKIVQPSKVGQVTQIIKGPMASIAFDSNGNKTPVLDGFLQKNGGTRKDTKVVLIKDTKTNKEISIVQLHKELKVSLGEALQKIAQQILDLAPKTKWMVWEQNVPAFIRPLRTIVAFHNDKKLSISLMNCKSNTLTSLPRYERPGCISLKSAQEYLAFLQSYGIILSPKKRAARITRESSEKNTQKIGKFTTMIEKNTFLTENPHGKQLALEKRYTELPKELVTLILEKNQMYPMTSNDKGEIFYHIVANHYRVHKKIEHGNQKVAKARLDDGLFYFQLDIQKKLEDFEIGLKQVGFHPKAGTYFDKKKRISDLAEKFYKQMNKAMPETVQEALRLIKNDKATALGKEFPSLEGTIGKTYALRQGINKEVADMLADHYLPLTPEGELPKTEGAIILSIADKIDSLTTLAQVEKLPEGSHDPFEIRKTVYRLLALLLKGNVSIGELPFSDALYAFINKRFQQILEDEGIPHWIANGVSKSKEKDFARKYEYAKRLQQLTAEKNDTAEQVLDTMKRVNNITQKEPELRISLDEVKPANLTIQAEKDLFNLHQRNSEGFAPEAIFELGATLNNYFNDVLVMDKDPEVKRLRIGQLKLIQETLEKNFMLDFT